VPLYCVYEQPLSPSPSAWVTIVSPYEGEILWSLGDEPSSDPLVGSYQCSVEDTVEELISKGVSREQVLVFQQDF
jgi:hypothetical protein